MRFLSAISGREPGDSCKWELGSQSFPLRVSLQQARDFFVVAPRPAAGVYRAKCLGSVPRDISPGMSERVSHFESRARKCPKISRVCLECPGHFFRINDTLGTPFGHSQAQARRVLATPLRGHSRGRFGPEGPEELL